MGSVSPFQSVSTPFALPSGSTPYRRPIIFGRAVAIFFGLQPPTVWSAHAYPWLKIGLHLGHADCEMTLGKGGAERTVVLRGEHVCFIGAHEVHGIRWKTHAPMVWIFMDGDYLKQIGFEHVSGVTCVELVKLVRHDLGIFRLAALFHEECLFKENLVRLYVEAKGTLLATRLLCAQFGKSPQPANVTVGLNSAAFQKVQDYIRSKLGRSEGRPRHFPVGASRAELSNAALAKVAGQSEHHFIRQFKARTLKTPQEFVMQCRLEKAEELILAENYSPKEAAYAAGFCEPGHFYRRFRKRYGRSPHDLLKQPRP